MDQEGNRQFEQAVDTAMVWLARLRSDHASHEDQQAFALWLGEHSSHPRAMDEALELWDDLAVVRHLGVTTEMPDRTDNRPRWLPAAMAVAACLVLAIFLWPQSDTEPFNGRYQTAMGERSEIILPDGSRALLNTSSAVDITYSDDQRHVVLQRGEVWFQVQADETRPFHRPVV